MKNWTFLILTFFVKNLAAETAEFRLSLLANEQRFETGTDPVMSSRQPVNLALGLRLAKHRISLEYSAFGEKTGNDTFHIERKFQDLLGWYRYAWWTRGMWGLTAGLGLGTYQEEVTTYFYNLKENTSSGAQWATGAGLGLEFEPISYLVFSIEGRLIAGQNLDPNPNPSALGRISLQF